MRIVVTGGAGFIGSTVVRMLVGERNATVLNIDKLTASSSLASLDAIAQSPRYSFRKGDVCDREHVTALLHAFAPDAIVHAAFERQSNAAGGKVAEVIETNVLGTWSMLDAARDYWSTLPANRQQKFRFLSVSTTAEQGSLAAASRSGADELVTAWYKSYGMPTIVSKAADTFGAHQFPTEAIPAAVIAAIDGRAPAEQTGEPRDWLHVEDHARALLAMLEKGTPGATYPVHGRGRLVPSALARRVSELVERHGARAAAAADGFRPDDTVKASVSSKSNATRPLRIEQDTDWRAQETVETALSKTVRWYLANEAWWRPLVAAQAAGQSYGILRIA